MKTQKIKQTQSSFFATAPSALSGAATVMNLAGNFYRFNLPANDQSALSNDFRMIGQDMRDALKSR